MVNIVHRLGFKAQEKDVYSALSTIEGLARWWTEEVEGESKVGGDIHFIFKNPQGELKGTMTMNVLELIPHQRIRWKCKEGPQEWIDTEIVFEIKRQGGDTILLFSHRNWKEEVEFTYHCSMKWAVFLLSLRSFVETGKGGPSPHDLKIDNWN